MGYRGMGRRSVAVEFDTRMDARNGDPDGNHVGVNVGGSARSLATALVEGMLNSGDRWFVWITFEPDAPAGSKSSSSTSSKSSSGEGGGGGAGAGRLRVYLAARRVRPDRALLDVPLSLCSVLQPSPSQSSVFLSFSASSSSASASLVPQEHRVLWWELQTGPSDPCFGVSKLSPSSAFCRSGVSSSCPNPPPVFASAAGDGVVPAGDGGADGAGVKAFAPSADDGGEGETGGCVIDVCGAGDKNPCGVGNCVNDGYGYYTCICPPDFYLGKSTFGAPSCAPGPSENYLVVPGVGVQCYHIHPLFGLTLDEFLAQNENLSCDAPLPEGTMVNVKPSNPDARPCSVFYTTRQSETCESIATAFNLTSASSCPDPDQPCAAALLLLNPGLDCDADPSGKDLPAGLSVCVERGTANVPVCGRTVVVESAENATCASLLAGLKPPLNPAELYRMNPGIYCDQLLPPSKDSGFPGSEICVDVGMAMTMGSCPRSEVYLATDNDRCGAIQFRFFKGIKNCYKRINGYDCLDRLTRGTRICLPDPAKIRQGRCSV
ncbi:hypothetical protein CLOM_g10993 [Closterium sp. NIES-68]|nr:hypothetical protein CLOM_g10993 [Closterium sp. NIES-68]GJP71154.1 hypothetical protein CLOP_g2001 [Closterium sp. NIES-67]